MKVTVAVAWKLVKLEQFTGMTWETLKIFSAKQGGNAKAATNSDVVGPRFAAPIGQ